MTARYDLDESVIDWDALFRDAVAAPDAATFTSVVSASGALMVLDGSAWLSGSGARFANFDEAVVGYATIGDLRRLLTVLIQDDFFAMGSPDEGFWDGTYDWVLRELASREGMRYLDTRSWLPQRIHPCPRCGDRERIRMVVHGMPAAPPNDDDADRIIFAGCVIEYGPQPQRHCPQCDLWYLTGGSVVSGLEP